MVSNEILTRYNEMMKEYAERDRKWKAWCKEQGTINNTGAEIREQLARGYGTACNPNTSTLGFYY